MKKNTFTGLDYWKLADELSVVDAAFLTLLCEPGHFSLSNPENPSESLVFKVAGWSDDQLERIGEYEDGRVMVDSSQFRAVFKALRNAIISNKLKAKIVNWARHPEHQFYAGEYLRVPEDPDEDIRNYGFALSRGLPTVFSNSDSITTLSKNAEDRVLYILKEPDWCQTTIEVEHLKAWFNGRGVAPPFFFPDGVPDGFRDSSHKRYSPKLATAIAAWEAVKRPAKKKSVKQSLVDWIISNGVGFGLGNSDGIVTPTAAEEIAKVANWKTTGGANPTFVEDTELEISEEETTQNFERVSDREALPYYAPAREDDDESPF